MMSDELALTAQRGRRALLSLAFAGLAAAVVFASGARAADPPVVTAGVGSGGKTDACVNDQHSGADPSASDPNNAAQVNDGSCQGAADSSASGSGSTTSGGSTSATSKTGGSSKTSGSSKSTARAWVAATGAFGLQIVRVRYDTSRASATKRFRVFVTLRDVRGKLVRDAIVSIGRVPGARSTISSTHSTFTNRLGQARLVLPVTSKMLGKRLLLKISARTPSTRALTLRSVRLPKLG
jgi:hypothetical protein